MICWILIFLAIDSVKLRANASHKQSKTLSFIEKEEKKLKERLRQLIEVAGRDGSLQEEEQKALAGRLHRLEEAKTVLKERIGVKAACGSEKARQEIRNREDKHN